MSRAVLIDNIAKKGDMSNAEAKRIVDLVFEEISAGLKKATQEGRRYAIHNFGTFAITQRPERQGRNPRTGETIRIQASNVLKFKPSAAFERAVGAARMPSAR